MGEMFHTSEKEREFIEVKYRIKLQFGVQK